MSKINCTIHKWSFKKSDTNKNMQVYYYGAWFPGATVLKKEDALLIKHAPGMAAFLYDLYGELEERENKGDFSLNHYYAEIGKILEDLGVEL